MAVRGVKPFQEHERHLDVMAGLVPAIPIL